MSTPHYVFSMLSIIVNGEANESLTTRLTYIRCKNFNFGGRANKGETNYSTHIFTGKQTLQGLSRKSIIMNHQPHLHLLFLESSCRDYYNYPSQKIQPKILPLLIL